MKEELGENQKVVYASIFELTPFPAISFPRFQRLNRRSESFVSPAARNR
jgi:hypothetical protein